MIARRSAYLAKTSAKTSRSDRSSQYPFTRYRAANSGGNRTTPSSIPAPHPSRMENGEWRIAILYPRSSIFDRLHLCGAGEPAIDYNDLAGDEAVMQNKAQHAVGYVIFSAAALERRVF